MAAVQKRTLDAQDFYIVDGMFKLDFVAMLHETAKRLPFENSDVDHDKAQHIRHWRHDFPAEALLRSPLLKPWYDQVEAKTADLFGRAKGGLAQAYCNNHGYGDHTHPHIDGPSGVTVLYYVNAEWKRDWQGETMLFEAAGDAHHAVAPRPGRLLMFSSKICHRGGTPSRTCNDRRLVMVLKFAGEGR